MKVMSFATTVSGIVSLAALLLLGQSPCEASCIDSPLRVRIGSRKKSCKKVANQQGYCGKQEIKSHCPNACGACGRFGTEDSEADFIFDGNKRDCAWLRALPDLGEISYYCEMDDIRETCRKSCSYFCAATTSEPTSSPSFEPSSSLQPSQAPSSTPSQSPSVYPSAIPSQAPSQAPSHALPAYRGWRLWTTPENLVKKTIWDVKEIEFYPTRDCSGDMVPNTGTAVDSGRASYQYVPSNAFGGSVQGIKIWGGRKDSDGYFWIGMEYDYDVKVGCVKVWNDNDTYAVNSLTVQALDENDDWVDIHVAENLDTSDNKLNTIPLYS